MIPGQDVFERRAWWAGFICGVGVGMGLTGIVRLVDWMVTL